MLSEEQRKQFEEMASKACNGFVSFDPMCHGCMSAFRAVKTAWDMATSQRVLSDDAHWSAGYRAGKEEATKAERERIALLLEGCASSVPRSITIKIFNPTPASKEKGE